MTSRFLRQKYVDAFHTYDKNGSGLLEYDDLFRQIQNIKEAKGWDNFHRDYLNLQAAKKTYWDELVHRIDGERMEQLTEKEWVQFLEGLCHDYKSTGKIPNWAGRIYYLLFESIDLDRDGDVTQEEYQIYLNSLGVEIDATPVFQKLDLDGDGVISLEEISDLFIQWLTSEDPNSPGNWFLTGENAAENMSN